MQMSEGATSSHSGCVPGAGRPGPVFGCGWTISPPLLYLQWRACFPPALAPIQHVLCLDCGPSQAGPPAGYEPPIGLTPTHPAARLCTAPPAPALLARVPTGRRIAIPPTRCRSRGRQAWSCALCMALTHDAHPLSASVKGCQAGVAQRHELGKHSWQSHRRRSGRNLGRPTGGRDWGAVAHTPAPGPSSLASLFGTPGTPGADAWASRAHAACAAATLVPPKGCQQSAEHWGHCLRVQLCVRMRALPAGRRARRTRCVYSDDRLCPLSRRPARRGLPAHARSLSAL